MKENIIQISPNPASEFVFVKKGIKQTIAYFLVDLDGKQIQSGNIFDDFHQINLEKLSSGTYVLRLISDSDVITQKIIVSK